MWGGWDSNPRPRDYELADVFAFLAVGLDAAVVEAWAEVGELDGGIGEQVPGDGEHGSADGNDRLLFASSACLAPVALAEEGAGPPGCDDGLAEDPGEVWVAAAG
jgi:hypothetical protein